MSEAIYAAIEGGGTKFVCALGHCAERILERVVLPTRDPAATLASVLDFIQAAQARHGAIRAVGIACFGPLDLRYGSQTFGKLMATPKPGWSGTDLVGPLQERLRVPVRIDTDVGAAALAELKLGAARDVGSVAYVTVGTGIGGGFAPTTWNGATLLHPEMGHLLVRRDPRDPDFPGICPFHRDCLEGLASGPAIQARWQADLSELGEAHVATSIIANYLGQLATSIALLASPQRIVFGGGVLTAGHLLTHVRSSAHQWLNGYVAPLYFAADFDRYIVGSGLGTEAGLAGAFLLAAEAERVTRPAQ